MNISFKQFCAAALAVAVLAAPASAAQLTKIQGEVLASDGTGFQLVTGPVTLSPGQQVFIRPGGSAELVFGDGCAVPVPEQQVVQIGETSPCAAQQQQQSQQVAQPGEAAPPFSNAVVIGGLAVAGGAALAIGLSGGGGGSKPASP